MWFGKLFGEREDDSEASEFPPHPAAASSKPAAPTVHASASTGKGPAPRKPTPGKGFDPYNSGSFDKNRAWEKVIR